MSRSPAHIVAAIATAVAVGAAAALLVVLVRDDDGSGGGVAETTATTTAAVEVTAYLSDRASVAEVDALRARIEGLQAQGVVEDFRYVSEEEALAEFRRTLSDPSILDELASNPLPATFVLVVSDAAAGDAVAAELEGDPAIDLQLGLSVSPSEAPAP